MEKGKIFGSIGLRSLAIGFLLAFALMFVLGAYEGDNGRYQCCPAGDESLAVFVIDTQTGETWRLGRSSTISYGTPRERKSERRSETPVRK